MRSDESLLVPIVPKVPTPSFISPADAGEERGGGIERIEGVERLERFEPTIVEIGGRSHS